MKKLALSFIFSLLFSSLAVAAGQENNDQGKLLFVILSKQAFIQKNPATKNYQLALRAVNAQAIAFNDRPIRQSGEIALSKLVSYWSTGSFKQDPPNAVMEAVRVDATNQPEKSVNYAVVLTNPVYNADKKQLQFDITALPGNSMALPDLAHSEYVALFIDQFCNDC